MYVSDRVISENHIISHFKVLNIHQLFIREIRVTGIESTETVQIDVD